MNETSTAERPALGATARRDAWWVEPVLVGIGFGLFIVYATWRAFEGAYYEWGPYLSPFYSPKLAFDWWKWSPAILILWVPAGFRATCYYYRKAYYRAYFLDPPACAVGHLGGNKYCGENTFPLILQNLHRYFLYAAIIVLGFLWYDAIISFNWDGHLGAGVGSLVLLGNVILLSNYTLGCHAFRHLIGGRLDCFSCSGAAKTQFKIWNVVTKLNEHHMLWAWLSLFSVGFADFYVRSVAAGLITDIRLF
ncbi:MAG TPA: hypothetical protein V6D08_03900 [Candidatus Obscuribacterales bacterium]